MKKVLAAALMVTLLAGASFADLNVKVGIDPYGRGKVDVERGKETKENSKFSGSAAVEYLYPFMSNLKAGAGVEYLFPRELDYDGSPEVSFMPVYATIQFHPLKNIAPEIFVKGNVGYNFLLDLDAKDANGQKGGMYFGFGAGYEFDFGLILEATYNFYYASWETKPGRDVDFSYSKLGINVGYKFNI